MLADYIFAEKARQDVGTIVDFLIEESPRAAELFIARLDAGIERIRRHVHIGPVALETGIADMRRISLPPYVVYYFARPELIQIVRVLHSARELDNIEFMSGN